MFKVAVIVQQILKGLNEAMSEEEKNYYHCKNCNEINQ
jgi:transcription initiation factor IIE alpha subunit